MKRLAALLLVAGMLPAVAQNAAPKPDPSSPFAIRPPDETSPFFLDPSGSRRAIGAGDSDLRDENTIAEYPRVRNTDDSAGGQIKRFFNGIFASVHLGPLRSAPVTSQLGVDPSSFPLQDRRELTATYTIRNNTREMMRLEYPTSQRIDIVTRDGNGVVIDKWSDDRSFDAVEGLVVINPNERIEYQEKIPTREMKAGQSYQVDAFATTEPKFESTATVNPQ